MLLIRRTIVAILLLMTAGLCFASFEKQPDDAVKILIDISGSMKKNDPHNLRAPAMRMLVNLLPKESKAGVWTFAKYSNQLAKYQKVSGWWQKYATKKSYRISSPGQFTDIALVLEDAMQNWQIPDENEKRSLILLTDGVVDVSKDLQESAESRQKIIDDIIPRLQKARIKVHTIALSVNADSDLMKKLSIETDGVYKMASTADELQRIFLHLFERSVKRETLPLKGNKFSVDASIDEMTVLVFKKTPQNTTEILSPSKSKYSKNSKDDSITWYSEAGYDLITVKKPQKGEWQIVADVDPDNRVMIVTDLKLRTSRMPNNVIAGESFNHYISLTEKDKVIDRGDFHKFITVNLEQTPPKGQKLDWIVEDHGLAADEQGGDGIYSFTFSKTLAEPGTHEIITYIDGSTFQRQDKQQVTVHETPLSIESKKIDDSEKQTHGYKVFVRITQNWIDLTTIKMVGELIQPDGLSEVVNLKKEKDAWTIAVPDMEYDRRYTLKIQVIGQTNTKREIKIRAPLLDLVVKKPKEEETQKVEEPPPKEIEDDKVDWLIIVLAIGGFNLVIVVVVIIMMLLGRRKQDIPILLDDDDEPEKQAEDIAAEQPEPEEKPEDAGLASEDAQEDASEDTSEGASEENNSSDEKTE